MPRPCLQTVMMSHANASRSRKSLQTFMSSAPSDAKAFWLAQGFLVTVCSPCKLVMSASRLVPTKLAAGLCCGHGQACGYTDPAETEAACRAKEDKAKFQQQQAAVREAMSKLRDENHAARGHLERKLDSLVRACTSATCIQMLDVSRVVHVM